MAENATTTLTRYLEQGTRLAESGRLKEAQAAFQVALRIRPESVVSLNSLGVIEILQGRYPNAFKFFLAAYKAEPENVVTIRNFGNVLERLHKYDEAIALYRSTLTTTQDETIGAALVGCLEKTTVSRTPVRLRFPGRINRQVVFVSDHPWSREAKIATALERNGWDTVLLHRHPIAPEKASPYSACRQYADPAQALELAHEYSPALFHVFSNWDFEVAAAIIRHKPGKIIFDDYDVMTGMVNMDIVRRSQPGQLELELFCLKNSDGLCCRSLETQYVFRRLYSFKKARRTYFPDYMWGGLLPDKPVQMGRGTKQNTLVYCGSYPDINPRDPQNNWIATLAAALRPIGFKLHLYPTASSDPDFQRHFDEPNVCFHRHRDPITLIYELSQYTAGIQVPNRMYRMTMRYGPEKKRYSTSCKIFDYLDAGLPVCLEDQRFQAWLLNRYGAAVHLVNEVLEAPDHFDVNRNLYQKKAILHSRFQHISNKLSVSGQIHRLIRFYEKVAMEE